MNTRNRKNGRLGFALSGTLMNLTLSGAVLLGAGTLGLSSARKVATMASYPSLNRQGQDTTSLIAQDIRRASSVESASNNQIVLKVAAAEGASSVTYAFDPTTRTLTRTEGGTTQTMLTDIDSFAFSLFQRPAADARFGILAPATATNAKLVGCRWSCSRKLGKANLDSENIEIAPVALRNRC